MAILCRPRSLPMARQDAARRRALEINPANATLHQEVMRTPVGRRGGPRRLVVVIGRRWPASGVRLTVQFLDGAPLDLRKRILSHMNAWSKTANVSFVETAGTGEVRIARLDSPDDMAGYWSYIGTEILEIEPDQPTLNLDSFTMKVSDAEFRRVVRHEAGHTLGFEHEHMRADLVKLIDRKKAIAFYDESQGWSAKEVEQQVLTPLASKSVMGTTEAHGRGPRACPLWRNQHRVFKYIVGRLRFDPDCRKRLRQAAPNELPALEKLLATFG